MTESLSTQPTHSADLDLKFVPYLTEEMKDPYMKVSEVFDPLGDIDPDFALLHDCARTTASLRDIYGATQEFPPQFIADMYANELRYVAHGMDSLFDLLLLNQKVGTQLQEVRVLFDMDRSQIAVADPLVGNDIHHVPRPGWKFLVEKMANELSPLTLTAGVLSDRPESDNHTKEEGEVIQASLEEDVAQRFEQAGISQHLDRSLIISCTEGRIVAGLPGYLQSGMKKSRSDFSDRALSQIKSGQLSAIAHVTDPTQEIDDLEYHSKVGVTAALEKEAPPGVAYMLFDDLKSVLLLHSARALGVYISPDIQPLLPDDLKYAGINL